MPASDKGHLDVPKAIPFDLSALKKNWRERIAAIKAEGVLPIIDVESRFNSNKLDLRGLAQGMDEAGVALIAFSHDASNAQWSDMAAREVFACRAAWRLLSGEELP
jgi:hypothetical protein